MGAFSNRQGGCGVKKAAGFTLTELLIVVSLIAILATIAVPGFGSLTRANQVSSASSELLNLLNYARSEALTRGVSTKVTAPSVSSWTGALQITTVGSTLLGDVETLRSFSNTGLGAAGVNSSASAAEVVFRPNGTVASAFSVKLCARNDRATTGKLVTVSQGGQASLTDFTPASASSTGCS